MTLYFQSFRFLRTSMSDLLILLLEVELEIVYFLYIGVLSFSNLTLTRLF